MTFTDETDLRLWLRSTVGADVAPVLSEDQIDAAILASRVVDSEGRFVGDDGYEPTWNGWWAAALLADQKAIAAVVTKTAQISSFTSEGSTVTRTEGATEVDFEALAAKFRALAFPASPVTVIDLGEKAPPLPRSTWEGVTPDVDPWRTR